MEIVVSLSTINNLTKVKQSGADGILFGGPFSLRFNYSLNEIKIINNYCTINNIKKYISIDSFIFEDDKVALYEYFDVLKGLNIDGIYFTDLAIINISKEYGLDDRLIYDSDTLMTNSLDSAFYLNKGIDVVLSRELTLEEVNKILDNHLGLIDMQVFGHLKMSYSKRKFLSNYFKHINKDIDITSKRNIKLVEENREYALPILEDKYGTRIYTDYVLLMYEELIELKPKLERCLLDDTFIKETDLVFDVIKDIKRLTKDNVEFLIENIENKYPDVYFSKGYLYNKTTMVKEDNDNE